MAALSGFDAELIPVDGIFVVGNRRSVNEGAVVELMKSIDEIGLQVPISVRIDETIPDPETGEIIGGYALITGRHRWEAYKRRGEKYIPATIKDISEIDAQLLEIAENLHRSDLTALERSEHIAEWIRLTKKKQEEERGVFSQIEKKLSERGRENEGRPEGGILAAARELGVGRNEAYRADKVAGLSEEAKEAARETGLDDNRTALLMAAEAPKEQQATIIRDIAEKKAADRNKIDEDVQARAVREVAKILAEFVPGTWWSELKANLYAAKDARRIANELTNITGESPMGKGDWS